MSTGKTSLKDLLDRETEKPVLEQLYLNCRVATDQLRRAPEVLNAITAAFNRVTSHNFQPGTLLRYMLNRRKEKDWPGLDGHARKFPPAGSLLSPNQLEVLKRLYTSLDVTSDEFLCRPRLAQQIAQEFAAVTGVHLAPQTLIAVIVAKRKRGEWPTIREAAEQERRPFSDIDEVARHHAAGN
jgi:hypothetical protein